jgi:S-adenosylmethionine uptake transporter
MFPNQSLTTRAFIAACVGIALFSAMDASMKGLSIALGAYNAMLWRLLTGCVIGGLAYFGMRSPWPSRPAMRLHIIRGTIGGAMALTFFWGIARVPLAEGIALSFIAPLITLYLAAVLLKERISRAAITASILGIAGVLVILAGRINGAYDREAMLGIGSIFISALLYAYNLILQRQQAQIASPVEIAFFQNVCAVTVLGSAAPFLAVFPAAAHWPAIGLSAVLAFASLLLMSWAYARAEAQILVPVEYTAFLWASLLGWLVFEEKVTIATLLGAALIVAGCIVAARYKPETGPVMEMV